MGFRVQIRGQPVAFFFSLVVFIFPPSVACNNAGVVSECKERGMVVCVKVCGIVSVRIVRVRDNNHCECITKCVNVVQRRIFVGDKGMN